jgi:hypothetical protein
VEELGCIQKLDRQWRQGQGGQKAGQGQQDPDFRLLIDGARGLRAVVDGRGEARMKIGPHGGKHETREHAGKRPARLINAAPSIPNLRAMIARTSRSTPAKRTAPHMKARPKPSSRRVPLMVSPKLTDKGETAHEPRIPKGRGKRNERGGY